MALTAVAGLLVVPWLLRRLSVSASEELQTLGVAGMLFALALMAQRAGYSLALGAFLLGAIVAETAHRAQVGRTFEGMRDVFSALFFTAVGMQIDARALGTEAGLITVVAVFTLVARSLAGATGLILAGARPRDALRAGLAVTPIGEFSFIIAQLGVAGGRGAGKILSAGGGRVAAHGAGGAGADAPWGKNRHGGCGRQPRWLRGWMWFYFRGLERAARRRRENRLWQLCRRRFVQIGVEVLVVTGLLVFSGAIVCRRSSRGWDGTGFSRRDRR